MKHILLVPDLPIEHWPSMDRYASRLVQQITDHASGLEISVASEIGSLTVDEGTRVPGRRESGSGTHRLEPTPTPSEFGRYLARYWFYPRRIKRTPADVLHVLDHSYAHVLNGESRTSVVTVHDLFPVIMLERSPSGLRERIRNRMLGKVLSGMRRANAWIVATDWLRGQLAEWLGKDEDIHVIPYGIDDAFFEQPGESQSETRRRWKIPEEAFLVLHVGSADRRKNLPAVIAVLGELRDTGIDAWLLQVGGTLTQGQTSELADRGLEPFTRQVGAVSENDLRLAYHAADVLLFPSHYEGFGLPVLEAMASRLPAVTSGAGGLAEVAGEAAIVVGGRDFQPYTDALRRIANDGQWRKELVNRGLERAARFTWSETAKKTVEVYRSLA